MLHIFPAANLRIETLRVGLDWLGQVRVVGGCVGLSWLVGLDGLGRGGIG